MHTELDYDDEKILTIGIVLTSLNVQGIGNNGCDVHDFDYPQAPTFLHIRLDTSKLYAHSQNWTHTSVGFERGGSDI